MWITIEDAPLYEINEDKVIRHKTTLNIKSPHRNTEHVRLYVASENGTQKEISRLIDKLYYTAFPEKVPGKKISGYPNYHILETGEVFGLYECKILKHAINRKGYVYVSIKDEFGTYVSKTVHRLVMEAYKYVTNASELTVNHIDGNKLNNHIDNLEWNTMKENLQHSYDTGLRSSQTVQLEGSLDGITWQLFNSGAELMKFYGITSRNNNLYNVARKNSNNETNRGKPAKEKPFRLHGVAVRYPEGA